MIYRKLITLILFSCILSISYAQKLYLDGIISGYNYNPSKGLFKKGKEILLEGRLNNVSIRISDKKEINVSTKSNTKGEFHVELPLGKEYWVKISKQDYEQIAFKIDLTKAALSENINFWSLELIINSFKYKKEKLKITEFGKLSYKSGSFYFKEFEQKSSIFTQKVDYSPLISLILKSISNNKSKVFVDKVNPKNEKGSRNRKPVNHQVKGEDMLVEPDTVKDLAFEIFKTSAYNELISSTNSLNGDFNFEDKELEIQKAKQQYELDKANAKTPLDFLLIEERGKLIIAAENELLHLKKIISQKESAINMKNNQLILFFIALILVIVMLFFILRANRIKTKLNSQLKEKNKKILDSINYAAKIQDAILPSKKEINSYLESFILFKPKDKVSGDYYWFEEINNKVIVAAVDCTGHGVPGAFMSMIGNVLMNKIILESNITSPKEILEALNSELKNALRQDNSNPFSSQDGMDMSICVIDKTTNTLTYAGAMNPLFLLKNGEIETLDVTKKGVGGFEFFKNKPFTEQVIDIVKGTQLYLLSDGYMDQFGGTTNEKYNLKRFKVLLKQCESKSIEEQQSLFENSIEEWQGSNEQTDDVLVIGINL